MIFAARRQPVQSAFKMQIPKAVSFQVVRGFASGGEEVSKCTPWVCVTIGGDFAASSFPYF